GVAFSKDIAYGLYRVTEAPEDNWAKPGDKLILADNLAGEVMAAARVGAFERIGDAGGFEGAILRHPLAALDSFWGYEVPMLAGDFVTDDAGTGFVHTAPSHGDDDYRLFMKNGLGDRITHNVLEDSSFAAHV